MEKKEFKVGETFQCGLLKLKVEKSKYELYPCDGCIFDVHLQCDGNPDILGNCSSFKREDKADVIFVKVEE